MAIDHARISSQKMPDGTMVSKPMKIFFPFLSKEEMESVMVAEHEKKK